MKARWWSILFVAVSLSGCQFLSRFLRAAFQEPSFNFKRLDLADVSLGALTLDTVWDLNNPNDVALSLASVEYALSVEDQQVISGAPPQGLSIAARGASELHFPANLKFQDLFGVVQTFLTRDSARWKVSGALGVQTPIGVLKLPLSREGVFEVPKIPDVQFQDPRVTNLSFTGATLEFPLTVTNKNTFALPVAQVAGRLAIGGVPVGTLSTGNLGTMEGKGARQVTLPLQVSFLSAAGAAFKALQGGSSQVTFEANLQSGPVTVPLKVDQLVKLLKQ